MDKPKEIMIEIESRCNLDCEFCFNKNAFAKNGRANVVNLSSDYIKKIIDSAVAYGVIALRFTGGEPLLREDIWDLAAYAKNKGVKLCLNTNALLIRDKKIASKIAKYFENVLLPLQYSDFYNINKYAKQKIKALQLLRSAGVPIVRIGSVATKDLIDNIFDFYKVISELDIKEWELYREIPVAGKIVDFNKKQAQKLVAALLKIKRGGGKRVFIANAIPFCVADPETVSQVAIGAEAVDGHTRFVIDPRGFAKPMYYYKENIGDPLDLEECWNHEFMQKMRNLDFIPSECKNCDYVKKCRGGCRFTVKKIAGDYYGKDVLMNNDYIKNEIKNRNG